jgi:hypothetical protein
MFGRLNRSHGDGRDGIGTREDNPPAHRLIDCSRPNITRPGNRTSGSIFSRIRIAEKISTPCPNGRLERNPTFYGSGTNRIGAVSPASHLLPNSFQTASGRSCDHCKVRANCVFPMLAWATMIHALRSQGSRRTISLLVTNPRITEWPMPETVKSELFPRAVGIEITGTVKFLRKILRPS